MSTYPNCFEATVAICIIGLLYSCGSLILNIIRFYVKGTSGAKKIYINPLRCCICYKHCDCYLIQHADGTAPHVNDDQKICIKCLSKIDSTCPLCRAPLVDL
jgi:hypothetical protein